MTRAEVRRIRRQQRRLAPEPQPIPLRIREGMLAALEELSRQNQVDYLVEIHKQLAEAARNGNIAAAREIFDRLEGRPTQAIELGKKQGQDDVAIDQLRKMPPAVAIGQLDAVIRRLTELRQEFLSAGAVNVDAKELPEGSQTDTAGPKSGMTEAGWPEGVEIVADTGAE
jgi:hypothetical protein